MPGYYNRDSTSAEGRTHSLPLTVVLAVRNEAVNLPRCLAALRRAQRILVIDSASTDATPEIVRSFGAELHQFQLGSGYPKKRQWAMETLKIETAWTLLIDADEVITPALWREIETAIHDTSAHAAYMVRKGFHFGGRCFRFGGFSHSAVCLLQTGRGRFERLLDNDDSGLDMEVHERVIVDGSIGSLITPLIHEDLKGLDAYVERHRRYATWEAQIRARALRGDGYGFDAIKPRWFGNSQERRRALKLVMMRVPFEHLLWFAYHYLFRLGFLEGQRGLLASRIRFDYIRQVKERVRNLLDTADQALMSQVK